jgi:hypothetical protein
MKTPREILLEQHQTATPKLDAIRSEVIAELNRQDAKLQRGTINLASWRLGGFQKIWLELIFPSRRIWTSLAVIWIFIFIFNFSQRDRSQIATAKISAPEMMSFGEQQKLLNELLADRSLPLNVERPKVFSPQPRSECVEILTT